MSTSVLRIYVLETLNSTQYVQVATTEMRADPNIVATAPAHTPLAKALKQEGIPLVVASTDQDAVAEAVNAWAATIGFNVQTYDTRYGKFKLRCQCRLTCRCKWMVRTSASETNE
jgi:hypothetical protein